MSNEWKRVKLEEICNIQAGGTPSRHKNEYWINGNIPWVKIGDMSSKFITSTNEFITEIGLKNSAAKLFPKGTLLFSIFATLGAVSILEIDATTNQAIAGINIKSKKEVFNSFLYYYLVSIKKDIEKIGRGVAQNNINLGILKKYLIPIPTIDKQQEIAQILDKANELIEKHKEQLRELDCLAESVFYDMFGDPIRNSKRWEKKQLSALGKWQSGGTPSRKNSDYFKGKIPWITSGELNNIFIYTSNEFITKEAVDNSNAKLIPTGSLLLGMYDSAALKSSISSTEMTCNQAIAYSKLDKSLCSVIYIYYIIQINKETYKKEQRGIRQKNLNLSMIKDIEIIYPPLFLQHQFASIIEKIEAQKAKVKEALKESEDLFQRLMQDLFNPKYHEK